MEEDRYGDATQKKLLNGVLDRYALVPKRKKKKKSVPSKSSLSDSEALTERAQMKDVGSFISQKSTIREKRTGIEMAESLR